MLIVFFQDVSGALFLRKRYSQYPLAVLRISFLSVSGMGLLSLSSRKQDRIGGDLTFLLELEVPRPRSRRLSSLTLALVPPFRSCLYSVESQCLWFGKSV